MQEICPAYASELSTAMPDARREARRAWLWVTLADESLVPGNGSLFGNTGAGKYMK